MIVIVRSTIGAGWAYNLETVSFASKGSVFLVGQSCVRQSTVRDEGELEESPDALQRMSFAQSV